MKLSKPDSIPKETRMLRMADQYKFGGDHRNDCVCPVCKKRSGEHYDYCVCPICKSSGGEHNSKCTCPMCQKVGGYVIVGFPITLLHRYGLARGKLCGAFFLASGYLLSNGAIGVLR